MRRYIVLLFGVISLSALSAQEAPEPTQRPDAAYRIFRTKNIYMLLELDTRNGRIWEVQWGDGESRFKQPLDTERRADADKPGRFTLEPTSNIFTFVLIDQEDGRIWHVQWGKGRFVIPIQCQTDECWLSMWTPAPPKN